MTEQKWTFDTLPEWARNIVKEAAASTAKPDDRPTPDPGRAEWPLLLDAAVVSRFVPKDLAPGQASGQVREEAERAVLSMSATTHHAEGIRWSLTPESRKAILERADPKAIDEAIARTASTGQFRDAVTGALQRLLQRTATDEPSSSSLPLLEATRVAVSWLGGLSSLSLPPLDTLDRQINLRRLLAEFQRMVGVVTERQSTERPDRFFGRDEEMETLRSYVGTVAADSTRAGAARLFTNIRRRFTGWKPLSVWGVGGVGKTTLVASFMLEHAESAASRYPFAYLDFDRTTVSPRYPERLLAEICTQVSSQFPDIAERLQAIQAEALQLGRTTQMTLDHARNDRLVELARQFRTTIDAHLGAGERRLQSARPFLLVFDTFEVVQYGGDLTLPELLVRGFSLDGTTPWPRLRLVICGRQSVERFNGDTEKLQLEGLLVDGASQMLATLAADAGKPISLAQCGEIISRVTDAGIDGRRRVPPLRIRLLAEEFRTQPEDGPTIAQSLIDELKKPLDQQERVAKLFIDGILIRRVLRHISDKRVKALADPGLVVRRFDPDVIREVMTPATPNPDASEGSTEPWVIDRAEATAIFEKFSREVGLVLSEDGGRWLRHRPDVRREMLPLIRVKSRRQFDDLHARAFTYYDRLCREQPRNLDAAAEALYHALWLGKSMTEWYELWRPDVGFQPRVDPAEFEDGTPPHVFLRAKRYDGLSAGEVRMLPPPLALEWLQRRAAALMGEYRIDVELDALRPAMGAEFETLDGSAPAAASSARLLARDGRWDDALKIVERQRGLAGVDAYVGAARNVRTYIEGALDPDTARLSMARTRATIRAKSMLPDDDYAEPADAAVLTTDPLVRLELLSYWMLRSARSNRQSLLSLVDDACAQIGHDHWLKNPRLLRIAVIVATDIGKLSPILIEAMVGVPRDPAAVELVRALLAPVRMQNAQEDELPRLFDALRRGPNLDASVALDGHWRRIRDALIQQLRFDDEVQHRLRPVLRRLVAYDHREWIAPLGNALNRSLRQSGGDVARELLAHGRFGRGAGDDGVSIVESIAAEGRLLEFADAVAKARDAFAEWSSDAVLNTVSGLGAAMVAWQDRLLASPNLRCPEHDRLPSYATEIAIKYLEPQPLELAHRHLDALSERLSKKPLDVEQLVWSLDSDDVAERIVGYRQLQLTPEPSLNRSMPAARRRDLEIAGSRNETRPLWNWLEVFHQHVAKGPAVPAADRDQVRAAITDVERFLASRPDLDPGRECARSARALRSRIEDTR